MCLRFVGSTITTTYSKAVNVITSRGGAPRLVDYVAAKTAMVIVCATKVVVTEGWHLGFAFSVSAAPFSGLLGLKRNDPMIEPGGVHECFRLSDRI